jgi:CheY-like chemotaxis protein
MANGMSKQTRPTVLIVDDERRIADTFAEILRQHGYETVAAYDGQSGLEHARSLSPGAIISDISMPGMNGVEMAIQILQFLPACQILLVSAYRAGALLESAAARGYTFEMLLKPVHPQELVAKLNQRCNNAA